MRTQHWALALGASILAACSGYGAPDSVVYGQDVLTMHSPTYDPGVADSVYYLDPQAKVIDGDPSVPGNISFIDITSGQYAGIGNAIDANMAAYGYATKVLSLPAQGTPNTVGIHLAVLKGTAATYYPGYWCDYWYYYSCYYSWYYAGSYNYGMVVVEMVDFSKLPQPPPASNSAPVLWQAGIYGVSSGVAYDIPRAVSGVNQAFAQSPYLAH